jgi:nitrogen fixation protein NifU and related proteins
VSELGDLYQEVILDHNKNPRNFRDMPGHDAMAHGHNPLCGDSLVVYAKVDGDKVADVSFKGSGCAISKASASLMTEYVHGKSKADIERAYHAFHDLVTGKVAESEASGVPMGKLAALAGVAEFPVRVKCATLAWHTLHAVLHGEKKPVTTE